MRWWNNWAIRQPDKAPLIIGYPLPQQPQPQPEQQHLCGPPELRSSTTPQLFPMGRASTLQHTACCSPHMVTEEASEKKKKKKNAFADNKPQTLQNNHGHVWGVIKKTDVCSFVCQNSFSNKTKSMTEMNRCTELL